MCNVADVFYGFLSSSAFRSNTVITFHAGKALWPFYNFRKLIHGDISARETTKSGCRLAQGFDGVIKSPAFLGQGSAWQSFAQIHSVPHTLDLIK